MIQFISEFNLPKEFSKKKKFDLMKGLFIPKDKWKDPNEDSKLDWNINVDKDKYFLTYDECIKDTIQHCLDNKITDDIIKNGYVAITYFTVPSNLLNSIPLLVNVHGEVEDCEWDPNTLSFYATLRNYLSPSRDWTEIEMTINTFKIDNIVCQPDGKSFKLVDCSVYPVIDHTAL